MFSRYFFTKKDRAKAKSEDRALIGIVHGDEGGEWTFTNTMERGRAAFLIRMYHALNHGLTPAAAFVKANEEREDLLSLISKFPKESVVGPEEKN